MRSGERSSSNTARCSTASPSRLGWVQSYGTRCVKPPLLFGDASRPAHDGALVHLCAVADHAPHEAMLTGPITIRSGAQKRDDLPRPITRQLRAKVR